MPNINGVDFTELVGSCKLDASSSGLNGVRILDCAWEDRKDAVEALLGKIVINNGVRNTILPPDQFPGWTNLEAESLSMDPIKLTGEDDIEGGAGYELARFTVNYKVLEYSQDSQDDGDSNAGQFYDTEQVDFEPSFVSVPGGTYTVGVSKALDITAIPVPLATRTFTKRDLATIPDFMEFVGKVNDSAFPPGRTSAASAGSLMFAGIKTTKKTNSEGLIRYDVQYVFKERYWSWNYAIDPKTGSWAPIVDNSGKPLFSSIDFSLLAIA